MILHDSFHDGDEDMDIIIIKKNDSISDKDLIDKARDMLENF